MPGESVLMIDDEKEIRELVGMYITREGFSFIEAETGAEALQKAKEHNPDIILLDIFLPDVDGIELCREIRRFSITPILFISCKDSDLDKIIGLSAGGDDYISKPFNTIELVARIKAQLRRSKFFLENAKAINIEETSKKNILRSSSITLDLNSYDVSLDNDPIKLSTKEFQLLRFFMNNTKQVLSPEHLLDKLWGFESTNDYKTVIVHIGNLRKKLRKNKDKREIIVTVRGAGYKFSEDVEAL